MIAFFILLIIVESLKKYHNTNVFPKRSEAFSVSRNKIKFLFLDTKVV